MDDLILGEIASCKDMGYQSIGLIVKTERDAISLHHRLKKRHNLKLVHNGALTDIRGVIIIPIYLAKGLEFDSVLICDADRSHYHTEDDKRLLYIASTRALHRLSLYYTGDMSPLL